MKPCCFNIISCDEYEKLIEGYEINGPMLGGEVGKHHYCPKNAEEAARLVAGNTWLLVILLIIEFSIM